MSKTLYELIRADTALPELLMGDLRTALAPHYQQAERELLLRRCGALVDAFLEAARGDASALAVHVRNITEERIGEGYYLSEIQRALNALEARAWEAAVNGSNVADLVTHLTLIRDAVGQAKDDLARIYLAHKERAEATVARLEREIEELFKGTEAHVEPEDEAHAQPLALP
jgi:hypothetical protein